MLIADLIISKNLAGGEYDFKWIILLKRSHGANENK
jgi:hypothetical protein